MQHFEPGNYDCEAVMGSQTKCREDDFTMPLGTSPMLALNLQSWTELQSWFDATRFESTFVWSDSRCGHAIHFTSLHSHNSLHYNSSDPPFHTHLFRSQAELFLHFLSSTELFSSRVIKTLLLRRNFVTGSHNSFFQGQPFAYRLRNEAPTDSYHFRKTFARRSQDEHRISYAAR